MRINKLLSVADFERKALSILPRAVVGFLCGGAEDNVSLNENRQVFERLLFLSRSLSGATEVSRRVSLWGRQYTAPIGIAPMGVGALFAYECDRALADAASAHGIPHIVSGMSTVPLERLQKTAPGGWYQAYVSADTASIGRLADRLHAADVDVFVLTVDTAARGNRENNLRAGFSIPLRPNWRLLADGVLHLRWAATVFVRTLIADGIPRFCNVGDGAGQRITAAAPPGPRNGAGLSWTHVAWIRERWKGRLVLKGLLHPGDAARAAAPGVDGVIVSNHGGRQLDGASSPLQALPGVLAAVPQGFLVMIDGGFRRGADVLKAVALGASLVFLGRSMMYGAVVGAAAGVGAVIDLLNAEIDRNLALLGCRGIADLSADLLVAAAAPALGRG
ncbi:L-lactate dehydrogenase (cytochrome) [Paraburkholderia sp. JPY465]|uniref:alpha-hydroxy acid oxidase n=1 Tax=Paraburkholderia sp. JPY465 TaxID=3042285 RepID=UPI003D22CFBE